MTACLAGGLLTCLLAPAPAIGGTLNTVSRLLVQERGSKTVVRLRGSRRPNFSVFKLERPPRLTIDLANCRLSGVSNLIDVDSWAVSQIATTQFRTNASTIARVMVNFRRRAHYTVRTVGSDLVVTIMPSKAKPRGTKALSAELVRAKRAAATAEGVAAKARQTAEQFQSRLRERDAQLGRLRGEVVRAKAAARQQPKVSKLRADVARAEARARKAQRLRQQTKAAIAEARRLQRSAELARKKAETARRRAELARREADARAKTLSGTIARVAADQRGRVDRAARSAARLQKALAGAKQRERAQRDLLQQAQRKLAHFRELAAKEATAKSRLATAVAHGRALERSLRGRVAGLQRNLGRQRSVADQARQRAERLQRAAERARQRVAAERATDAKQREQRKLQRAEQRLTAARAARARAEQDRARLSKALSSVTRERLDAQRKLSRLRDELTAAERRLPSVRAKAASARAKLTGARRALQEVRQAQATEQQALRALKKRRAEAEQALKQTAQRSERKRAELDRRRRQLAKLSAGWKGGSAKAAPKSAPKKLARVRNLQFVDRPDEVRIEVDLEGRASHRLEGGAGAPLLSLSGVELPKRLQRTLDTREFEGPVRRVSSFVVNRRSGTVHVKVAVNGTPQHRLSQQGGKLIWTFAKAATARRGTFKRPAVGARTENYRSVKVGAGRSRGVRLRRKRYTGRRIDLDFKDADIHNILRLLSDVGNVNIITSDAVSGRVTIRMKNVPWDHGLDVILRAKGLGMVREGNLLRVAPRGDLEKEREAELARQKQVVLLKPLETRLIPLSYAQASAVLPKLQYTLSPRGKLTFDQRTNTIIARDIAANLNLVEQMIRNLDTQTPQVLIEARIVEARTNYSKQIGIQWGGAFTATAANGNSTGLVFPNEIGIGGGTDDGAAPTGGILLGQAANPNFLVNMPAGTGLNSGAALGLALGSLSGAFNLSLRLSAAEATGDIRIISSPRITTMDNVQAKISQGVTIPFAQVSANGVQTTFKDAKLDLTVTPHVTADGSIVMKVNINKNEPDFVNTGPRGDPTILTKQASTEMLVKDGQTAVIGGIYTTRDGRAWNKVPWLADIPILGWFFKNRRENSDREEVLVFITPRIVNRAESIGE